MNAFKDIITSMVGGLFAIAMLYLLTNKNSNASGLVKETFDGFSGALSTAMGGSTKM